MREVLRATRRRDAQAAEWLEVIDRFDRAVVAEAPVEDLVQIAHGLTGLTVVVRDEWNSVDMTIPSAKNGSHQDLSAVLAAAVHQARLRGRGSFKVSIPRRSAIVSSIEIGSGQVGFAALLSHKSRNWVPLDHLVVERLAVAVSARALHTRNQRLREDYFGSGAIERLLSGDLSEYDLAEAARQMRLPVGGTYIVAALEQMPPNAVAPEAVGAIATRVLGSVSPLVRATVIGRVVAAVAQEVPGIADCYTRIASVDEHPGYRVQVGVGTQSVLADLSRSWTQACEALALRRLISSSDVAFFGDLGIVHLLAQIPKDEILRTELFGRLTDPQVQRGHPSDLDVLEAYLEEGSLRLTASRVFLHHTTVEHRIRRIADHLQLDLSRPTERFQAQLLLNLFRILQSQEATNL